MKTKDGYTYCPNPECYEGKLFEDAHDQGARCPVCRGSAEVTQGLAKVYDRALYHGVAGFASRGKFDLPGQYKASWDLFLVEVGENEYRQANDGSTDHALVAYWLVRDWMRRPGLRVVPGRVADPEGRPMHAVIIQATNLKLILTGLSWGYAGTGPTGFAAVLHDLMPESWADMWAARSAIAALKQNEGGWVFAADALTTVDIEGRWCTCGHVERIHTDDGCQGERFSGEKCSCKSFVVGIDKEGS